jgi:hypothetical protein
MVDDKIGTKPYLGIEIDYDKEKQFDKFSLDTLKDFTTTVPLVGSCLALLYLVTGVRVVGYLSLVSLIMFLTVATVYLITTMRTFGWRVQVEALVDIGAILGATVFLLLMAVVLLVQFHSCML